MFDTTANLVTMSMAGIPTVIVMLWLGCFKVDALHDQERMANFSGFPMDTTLSFHKFIRLQLLTHPWLMAGWPARWDPRRWNWLHRYGVIYVSWGLALGVACLIWLAIGESQATPSQSPTASSATAVAVAAQFASMVTQLVTDRPLDLLIRGSDRLEHVRLVTWGLSLVF